MLNVNKENSGCSFYFNQYISERNITGTAKIRLFYQTYSWGLVFIYLIHTKYRESCDKPILTNRGIPRCWFITSRNSMKMHLTQWNCAIANWATIIRIICRPTQMILTFATGRPLILIPVSSHFICAFICIICAYDVMFASMWSYLLFMCSYIWFI
jgi:hypothetical protein